MAIKALLFDKDGTLFHFEATWEGWAMAVLDRLTNGDHEAARKIGAAIGFDYDAMQFARDSVVIAGTPEEVVQALLPFFDKTPSELETILNAEAATAPQAPAVDLPAVLGDLRAHGLKLGLATNDAEMPARAHLAGAQIIDLFDFISGYDSGFGGKPAPGQCLAFAQKIGVAPENIAMVGDSLHDLEAGRAAGMHTIGVLTGPATEAVLAPHCDVVLPDISHILPWLTSM